MSKSTGLWHSVPGEGYKRCSAMKGKCPFQQSPHLTDEEYQEALKSQYKLIATDDEMSKDEVVADFMFDPNAKDKLNDRIDYLLKSNEVISFEQFGGVSIGDEKLTNVEVLQEVGDLNEAYDNSMNKNPAKWMSDNYGVENIYNSHEEAKKYAMSDKVINDTPYEIGNVYNESQPNHFVYYVGDDGNTHRMNAFNAYCHNINAEKVTNVLSEDDIKSSLISMSKRAGSGGLYEDTKADNILHELIK